MKNKLKIGDYVKPIKKLENGELIFCKCRKNDKNRYGKVLNIYRNKKENVEFYYIGLHDSMKGNFIDFCI